MGAYHPTMVKQFYEENAIRTASPVKLVVLLYEGALKFFRLAERSFSEGDSSSARMYVLKAEKIILELLGSLNFEEGGEIARNLSALYRFIIGECARLNTQNYSEVLSGIIRILSGLRDAWKELEARGAGS